MSIVIGTENFADRPNSLLKSRARIFVGALSYAEKFSLQYQRIKATQNNRGGVTLDATGYCGVRTVNVCYRSSSIDSKLTHNQFSGRNVVTFLIRRARFIDLATLPRAMREV
jgi:hypothetical protein